MDEGAPRVAGSQTFAHLNTELAFIDNLAACDGLTARKVALDERLSGVALDPEFWPIVRRLRAFRGIDTLSALILALEVADFTRFQRAVQLGSWLGLGALTRAVRRVRPQRVDHQDRLEVRPADPRRGRMALRPPAPDRQDALRAPGRTARPRPGDRRRAQTRLYRVHKRMRERKKPGNVITVACARELACFLWAAATAP